MDKSGERERSIRREDYRRSLCFVLGLSQKTPWILSNGDLYDDWILCIGDQKDDENGVDKCRGFLDHLESK